MGGPSSRSPSPPVTDTPSRDAVSSDAADHLSPSRLTDLQAPWLADAGVQGIFNLITKTGHAVRAVGGCVRDSLLGRPAGDVDFATSLPAPEVMQVFEQHDIKVVPTGLPHGTVTVLWGEKPYQAYEVTTLRRDVETDGRHATVAYTDDWLVDACRRDFTINALYADADGRIYDPLASQHQSGLADLKSRHLRFIGDADQRITEDVLRSLRFFRFHFDLFADQPMDPAAIAAITQQRNRLGGLSGERVSQEISRIMCLPTIGGAVSAMVQAGIWQALFDAIPDAEMVKALVQMTPEEVTRVHDICGAAPMEEAAIYMLAILCAETGSSTAVAHRLRLSKKHTERMLALDHHELNQAVAQMWAENNEAQMRALLYRHGHQTFVDHLRRIFFQQISDVEDKEALHRRHAAWQEQAMMWQRPKLPVTASDLMAKGFDAGPGLGEALALCEARWVASDFRLDRETLLKGI